jgi:glycosyltransferase involved in cell wall biosynthesis
VTLTHANAEVIVVDDGSTGDPPQITDSYGERTRRTVLQPSAGSAAHRRNDAGALLQ